MKSLIGIAALVALGVLVDRGRETLGTSDVHSGRDSAAAHAVDARPGPPGPVGVVAQGGLRFDETLRPPELLRRLEPHELKLARAHKRR